jgi:DNA-directed RNA polymerase subunit RPC12/RpoP|nr:MAG TPA: Transcription initiation factor IIE, alpha FINGER, Transcription [Caudoviricetes sp.]
MSKEHVRLIDANALKKRVIKVMFRDCPESGEFYAVGTGDIDIMPTIDPESLRPTAHWENEEDFNGDPVVWFCSACKERFFLYDGTPEENDYKYCPYCGARMVNEDE